MTCRCFLSTIVCLLVGALFTTSAPAADWPMDRYDAQRTAATPQELPAKLHLQWVRQLPPLKPAWPDQPSLQFDAAYAPIVAGQTMFIGSPHDDSVLALSTETGAQKWKFITDGPVRFAPLAWEGCVYFVSDDGYLYCVSADEGKLLWRFRGGPSDRKILGNGRLISTWPARGAPVLVEGKIYFAASIWPFMGVFLHALDARTGQVVWTNDGDGSIYIPQPHHADSFGGVAPQGPLAAVGDKLLIPGGRSVPAVYDRHTGKLLHFRLADNNGTGGGWEVAALAHAYVNGGEIFDLDTGSHLDSTGDNPVIAGDVLYACSGKECSAYDVKGGGHTQTLDRRGEAVKKPAWSMTKSASFPLPGVQALIKAGSRLYAGSPNKVCAIDLPLRDNAEVSWQAAIEGQPANLLAADGRLFVVTREGHLYCFGEPGASATGVVGTSPVAAPVANAPGSERDDAWTVKAQTILQSTKQREGYAVVWGAGTGRLATELVRQSQLHVIVIERDVQRVAELRRKLMAEGLYGERVAVHAGTPETFMLPPYLASLMVSEDLQAAGIELNAVFLSRAFQALRPYGGVACLPVAEDKRKEFAQRLTESKVAQAQTRPAGDWVLLSRDGALPGAGDWTHEHADAANTRVSRDKLVQAPLGVLWFGGPSHEGILPRHGHGPQPQVIDGRLIIEGVNMLRAIDIYTGRLLWQTELPHVGDAYNNTAHQPGANASGTNYVSTPDGIYVIHGKGCVRLDPANGKPAKELALPPLQGETEAPRWSYLNVADDYLIAGVNYLADDAKGKSAVSSSKHLAVMNRHTGEVLWSRTARTGFRHNAICLGGGRVYLIDRPSADHLARLKRRGEFPDTKAQLAALDLRTGKELWTADADVFGTWLSYSARYDVLVEAGRVARDTLGDEARGMRAYQGRTGSVLWHQKSYSGPAMILRDTILKDRSACDLLTGAPRLRSDPLTGLAEEWTWTRGYGCNTPLASENLLTFRSGAAGFFDLANDGGTGNFGGFRSSCTNNLIVAGGVLTAPDYTRTCTCSYQNQTSLALVHMPENEMWTYDGSAEIAGPIERLGINFGAPGNRKAANGTLWLEYPHVGGPAPAVPVQLTPQKPEVFRHHVSHIEGDGLKWVAASGVNGLEAVRITLDKDGIEERAFTVRLHFAEPEHVKPGERVFDIVLQEREVLKNFDIVKEAGGRRRSVVKEFAGIRVRDDLTLRLSPSVESSRHLPILCGIELVMEMPRR